MVRMREPQRHPLGTRVADPLEGRTGSISAYDADSGLYTLLYSDDHRDVLDAAGVERFVIRQSAAEKAQQEQQKESDPNQFLGVAVSKSSTSYEGETLTTSGQVTQYFADIRKFRVLFNDGVYADLTLEEVKDAATAAEKRVGEEEPPAKKSKHRHHETQERPLNCQKFESRKIAYTMCRQVLSIILSQKKLSKLRTEKQKVILNNKDLQPKRALEAFVDADGLRTLEGVLTLWFRVDSTRSGCLLVMKVLAMLPGVKEAHLRKTTIAPTLRGIEKRSKALSNVDMVFGDLAHWIIQKWARTAMNRTFNPSARDRLLAQQAQISRAGSNGEVHVAAPSAAKKTPQQKETERLEALRTSNETAEQDPGEEVVVYLPQFNSLGSEDKRRPVRQTQLLESLADKINRDYEDSLKKHTENEEEKDDGVTAGRMVFGKPQLMKFSQYVPVIDLFATARSKIVGKNAAGAGTAENSQSSTGGEVDENSPLKPLPLPNKTKAPKKSILKVRSEEVIPVSQVQWN